MMTFSYVCSVDPWVLLSFLMWQQNGNMASGALEIETQGRFFWDEKFNFNVLVFSLLTFGLFIKYGFIFDLPNVTDVRLK